MKLYKAEATVTVFFLAKDQEDALLHAGEWAVKEAHENGIAVGAVDEVTDLAQIPGAWRGAIPWHPRGTNPDDKHCEMFLPALVP